MDLSDMVSVEEAANMLGYIKSSVALLCRQGKLEGAIKIGHQWFVPRKTVENYEKAPQGFAVVWARRREAERANREAELAAEDAIIENSSDLKENLEREILQCMRVLARKMSRLEKIIAQEKLRA